MDGRHHQATLFRLVDSFERVEILCYPEDMLSSDGGCDHAVLARVNKASNKFRKVQSFLCQEIGSECKKGEVYEDI